MVAAVVEGATRSKSDDGPRTGGFGKAKKSFLETTMRRGFVGDGDDAMTHLDVSGCPGRVHGAHARRSERASLPEEAIGARGDSTSRRGAGGGDIARGSRGARGFGASPGVPAAGAHRGRRAGRDDRNAVHAGRPSDDTDVSVACLTPRALTSDGPPPTDAFEKIRAKKSERGNISRINRPISMYHDPPLTGATLKCVSESFVVKPKSHTT